VDSLRQAIRVWHDAIRTEDTHLLNRGGRGVRSRFDQI
jgi:hypothetical protein